MGNQSYPVRRGAIGPGTPTAFDHEQIMNKINGTSYAELDRLSSTYRTLETLLGKAQADLAFHRGRLKTAWPQGSSSDAALAQIKRMEQAADELSKASGKFRTALDTASRTVATYKANPPEATGALGVVQDPKQESPMDKFAKDRAAQQHMDQLNKGLISAYSNIPPSVTLDLPNDRRGGLIAEGGNASEVPAGSGGETGQPGAQRIAPPSGETDRQGPSSVPSLGGNLPDVQGSPDQGGTDLEGTTPGGTGMPSGNPGQSQGSFQLQLI
ncbi:hypothetical protein [Actinomadura sp. 9N407]|uniref:hypothetical protein n=1 Tax=Actinomadura sp. 9N407 TaxID=3375154 RepID=UPI00378EC3AF